MKACFCSITRLPHTFLIILRLGEVIRVGFIRLHSAKVKLQAQCTGVKDFHDVAVVPFE